MHYPLRAIHDLVFQHLPPAQLLLLNTSRMGLLWQQAHCEVAGLTGVFVQAICSQPAKKEKKAMVHSFQAAAVVLCNRLHEYANMAETLPLKEHNKQELTAAYRTLRDQLFASLTVLDQFAALVNRHQALPTHAIEAARLWAQEAIAQVNAYWNKKTDPELLRIVLEPLTNFAIGETAPTLSARALDWLKQLVQQTIKLSISKPVDANTALLYLLIQLNCNSNALIRYASQHLRPNKLDEGSPVYLQQYRHILRQLQQLQPIPGLALHPSLPGCQLTLNHLLQQEIRLLAKQPHTPPLHKTENPAKNATSQPIFKSCLTMAQLAVFLRWCYQTGILRTETTEDLFKVVAKTVVTAGKGRFKPSSLQTEYYELDPAAVSGAKNYVIQLLNEARKYPQ